jgi:hypothetical protein
VPEFPACDRQFHAFHSSGSRPLTAIRYIVLHATESPAGSAEAVAVYFTGPTSGGSAHLVVDTHKCYGCLPDTVIPWGAPPLNTSGFHIEHCGYSEWTKAEWEPLKKTTLDRSAYKAALRCHARGIPAKTITDRQLAAGKVGGIVTHAQVSRVFKRSTHTDPGDGFPLGWYVSRVGLYLRQLDG